ncbi:MAG: hypothetical protein Q7T78_00525 [Rhodoferax sp.]|nr:hypothetical protein [Rhodoferax sp.]
MKNSLVICDTNDNGVQDTGEASTTTNAQGDFTFAPVCASTIVVSGGTSIDTGLEFKGRLKAPAGSAMATPLTSLMVSTGLTAAQLATALGLPAGTDVSKIDPMSNAELQKKTLAMQQIIQQVADSLGGMAQNTSPAAIQALYSEVAKAVATTLAANPSTVMINASGDVSASLVSSIVQKSVDNVKSTTNTALTTVNANMDAFSSSGIAALISGAIAAEAQSLVSASTADLVTKATALQSNPTVANTATQLSSLLTVGSLANMSSIIQALTDNNIVNLTAAALAQGVTVANLSVPSNNLTIANDSITFGIGLSSQTETLTAFKSTSGVTLAAKPDTVKFAYALNGTPIPAGGSVVSVGLEMTQASTGRVLQVILDKVNLSVAGSTLTATVPAGATLYAYGKTSGGASANLTIPNDVANQLITTSGSDLTFNATNVMNSIVAKVGAQSGSPFANLLNVKGTFTLKVLVSNLSIQSATAGAVKGLAVSVTSATDATQSIKTVTGSGVEGTFTLN